MSIDISQFQQVFFEESFEGLDVMENGLLQVNPEDYDSDTINEIFRAAHSIKGGAGTFGFKQVSDFTHVAETLLDEVREGSRKLEQSVVDLLLRAVDCLRDMMETLQEGGEPDMSDADALKAEFEALLNSASAPAAATPEASSPQKDQGEPAASGAGAAQHWKIYFKPGPEVLSTGNEPIRMFRELGSLDESAQLQVEAELDGLPDIDVLNSEESYLGWHIDLVAEVTKEQIEEVFEWVVDESELNIELLSPAEAPEKASSQADNSAQTEAENAPQALAGEAKAEDAPKIGGKAEVKSVAKKSGSEGSKPEVKKSAESSSIRVGIDKVDSLINMVGELVITQSMLGEIGANFNMSRLQRLQEGLAQLEHNTRELQESVMKIRMIPISFAFSRFPRLVRDLSGKLGKKIELVMSGESTELDKTVMEKIGDPLVHLVRNSLDHGIESPEKRRENDKPETGIITLNAYHQGGNVVIEIKDDGNGLNSEKILEKAINKGLVKEQDKLTDEQINDLIFQPGFSTADQVSDLSGRGVGMDVVRQNITSLNGSVEVTSTAGVGTTFIIRLPLTLAILDGQLVRVGKQIYIFPLVSIVESIQLDKEMLNNLAGGSDVLRLRNEYVPILRLYEIFNVDGDNSDLENTLLVVVECDNQKVGVVVDDLMGQQQVVVKSLEANYGRVDGISGATILGDGTVALIVDVSGLTRLTNMKPYYLDSSHEAA